MLFHTKHVQSFCPTVYRFYIPTTSGDEYIGGLHRSIEDVRAFIQWLIAEDYARYAYLHG